MKEGKRKLPRRTKLTGRKGRVTSPSLSVSSDTSDNEWSSSSTREEIDS
eukprot:CAMPEP_0184486678 /NCGR_PEP_ID=MMETSP0113_2-20130426/8295_1 /TAXON_ID=91329 /ORGANISM="Norrisiella sphaerica, Strain BC52" /LENGTH=48 /DNA_ID= /DNA_START= /DNA_END= /DNA_ORIENTATION=